MKKIYFCNGILIYYGNPAGYLSGQTVVLDSIFDKEEIRNYLLQKGNFSVEICSGVYDRLADGEKLDEIKKQTRERRLKIYQLNRDSPILMRFVSLAEREKRGFGKPQKEDYVLAYEGEVADFNLEDVWEKFGRKIASDFEGHALSISDVVEFSEGEASRFFYVEPRGFAEISFM